MTDAYDAVREAKNLLHPLMQHCEAVGRGESKCGGDETGKCEKAEAVRVAIDRAIEAVRREDQRAICNCHDLAADPHAPTLMRHDTIKECARSIVAEEGEIVRRDENEASIVAARRGEPNRRATYSTNAEVSMAYDDGRVDAAAAVRARISKEEG